MPAPSQVPNACSSQENGMRSPKCRNAESADSTTSGDTLRPDAIIHVVGTMMRERVVGEVN